TTERSLASSHTSTPSASPTAAPGCCTRRWAGCWVWPIRSCWSAPRPWTGHAAPVPPSTGWRPMGTVRWFEGPWSCCRWCVPTARAVSTWNVWSNISRVAAARWSVTRGTATPRKGPRSTWNSSPPRPRTHTCRWRHPSGRHSPDRTEPVLGAGRAHGDGRLRSAPTGADSAPFCFVVNTNDPGDLQEAQLAQVACSGFLCGFPDNEGEGAEDERARTPTRRRRGCGRNTRSTCRTGLGRRRRGTPWSAVTHRARSRNTGGDGHLRRLRELRRTRGAPRIRAHAAHRQRRARTQHPTRSARDDGARTR